MSPLLFLDAPSPRVSTALSAPDRTHDHINDSTQTQPNNLTNTVTTSRLPFRYQQYVCGMVQSFQDWCHRVLLLCIPRRSRCGLKTYQDTRYVWIPCADAQHKFLSGDVLKIWSNPRINFVGL